MDNDRFRLTCLRSWQTSDFRRCVDAMKRKDLPDVKRTLPSNVYPQYFQTSKKNAVIFLIFITEAIRMEYIEGLEYLRSQGIPFEILEERTGKILWSALVDSVQNARIVTLEYLLTISKLNKDPDTDMTLLMKACYFKRPECLEIILKSELKTTIKSQRGENNYTALHWCLVEKGSTSRSLQCVQILIDAGADLDFKEYVTPPKHNCLHMAAKVGMTPIVTYLLRQGVQLSDDDKQNNILHLLAPNCNSGHITECMGALIKSGLDVNAPNTNNETPIFLASLHGNCRFVDALIRSKCELNTKSGAHQLSPLLASLLESNFQIAEQLILTGCDVNLAAVNGFTPLMKAVKLSNMILIKLLLAHGADVNSTSQLGKSASDYCYKQNFHIASAHKNSKVSLKEYVNVTDFTDKCDREVVHDTHSDFEILKVLVEAGAELSPDSCLLHRAISIADLAGVAFLIDNGACVNKKNKRGDTPLMVAAKRGLQEIIKLLLTNGCDVNSRNFKRETALHKVIKSELSEKLNVILLLENGANVNLRDRDGDTPLMIAANRGLREVIKVLLANGCDVNNQNLEGETALHKIIQSEHSNKLKTVFLLLENGANVNLRNEDGKTVLRVAVEMALNAEEMKCTVNKMMGSRAEIIIKSEQVDQLENKTNVNSTEREAKPLFIKVDLSRKYIAVIKVLIENGVDLNLSDIDGKTVLMVAVKKRSRRLVELLLKANADVIQRDIYGHTALFYLDFGTDRRWVNILKLILMKGCDGTDLCAPSLQCLLLNTHEANIMMYLLIENCKLCPLYMEWYLIQFSDPLLLGKILYENGTAVKTVASLYRKLGVGSGRRKYEVVADNFQEYRKDRKLNFICRRVIRSCMGAGIMTNINKLPLPPKLKEFIKMNDVLPEQYFQLSLNDADDVPKCEIFCLQLDSDY
ncbi:serine/threonine-protein phosphatase 6 regulatory ankyrin repeat subunit B [Patella vulgata]|uniref:serine/threonine-protein phosphatase 6 regulatory ankyrin repeat subunit B n=1 Tax=Patella vulgata TaxID=6465 RepID=UPI0024A979F0|nr:serine/threonine-protein phosphatase 6 regulatory ankyrin repeat subunit B [Patella vulgata]